MLRPIVNLSKYPIHQLSSPAGRKLIDHCQTRLAADGFVALPEFVAPAVAASVVEESVRLEAGGAGFYSTERHKVFLADEDGSSSTSLPDGHPRRQEVSSSKLLFAADTIAPSSPLKVLYEWQPMVDFVKEALQQPTLYPSGCSLGKYIVNVFNPGDRLGWHFDNSEFSVNVILQPAEVGGAFQFAPQSHGAVDEMAEFPADEEVESQLNVVAPPLLSGSIYLFNGRHSLHRVSPVEQGKRINAIFTYNSAPDERLNDYTLLKFFGRTGAAEASAA